MDDQDGLAPMSVMRQALDALQQPVWLIDDAFRIIGYNEAVRAACRVIWQREPRLGESILEFTNPANRATFEEAYRACLAGATRAYPRDVMYPSGLRASYELSYVPLRAPDGRVVGCVFSALDVTARRNLEEKLAAGLRLETMAVLAGGLAHDFNNLLAAVRLQADALAADARDPAAVLASAQDIVGTVRRAAALVEQLLSFGRRETGARRRIAAAALVERALPLLRAVAGRDVAVALAPDPSPWSVDADPTQLERVLVNLAANARDAMPRGGTLSVAVVEARGERAVGDGEYVCIRVRDSGEGMDDATRARAFEPFFTTRQGRGGTGLGLAASWGIVTQHGGTMRIESARGAGTTVEVLLPRADAARPVAVDAVAIGEPAVPARRDLVGSTVLLVDDDDDVRAASARQLARAGVTVLAAHDRASALAYAQDGARVIDAAVIDGVLRVESGLELAQQLAALRPRLGIVVVSGLPSALDEARARGYGVLTKPFDRDEFLAAVRGAIARRGAGGASGG